MAVATTNTGDHPAVVAECGGRVVPIRRPDQLAQAVLELLVQPPQADFVRDAAASRLSVGQAVDYTLGVYQRLLRTDDGPLPAPRL